MRAILAKELLKAAKTNKDIFVLSGDLGYGMWDEFKKELPNQFVNCGASEQAMVDIAVGLALKGKIPFVYTITSFFMRAAESIHLYLSQESIPVILLGSGRDKDYKEDGVSHDATQVQKFLHDMNIDEYYPRDENDIPEYLNSAINSKRPAFISLVRR